MHDEVLRRYYGCGLVLPQLLDGLTVLDLVAGRDVYALSQLVGEQGRVIGGYDREQLIRRAVMKIFIAGYFVTLIVMCNSCMAISSGCMSLSWLMRVSM